MNYIGQQERTQDTPNENENPQNHSKSKFRLTTNDKIIDQIRKRYQY